MFSLGKSINLVIGETPTTTTYNGGYAISKVGDHSRGSPEGSLFDSYYTNV